jgi:predicted O-methyltransferase YrrM
MTFDEVERRLGDAPSTTTAQHARILYDFVLTHRFTSCLELGFYHGRSTCYIAAALDEIGKGGHVTTVDLVHTKAHDPNIHALLARTGLAALATPTFEPTSYTWFLKKEIEGATKNGATVPKYDFCFIDGAHNWFVDGFAFFLVDKLLVDGGWMLFDDYSWTHAGSKALKATEEVRNMPADERETAGVERVFELLVKQHPNYDHFRVEDGEWAWAQKVHADQVRPVRTDTRVDVRYTDPFLIRVIRKIRGN